MALLVTPNMTEITMCEAATNWSYASTITVDESFAQEGTYDVGIKVSEGESTLFSYTPPSALDMSSGEHLYAWVQVAGTIDTVVNRGIQAYFETDASNYGYFKVLGSENYGGGWHCICLDPGATPDGTSAGTINTASIAKIGFTFNVTSKAVGNNPNCFVDAVRYGTGLTITSAASDGITFQDIVDDENNDNYYGVLQKKNGVFLLQGELILGSTTTLIVDFDDTGQIVLFPDNDFVNDAFYGITVVGNSTGSTNVALSGCFIKSNGKSFFVDATDTNINGFDLDGMTFANAGEIELIQWQTLSNSVLDGCGQFIPQGATVTTVTIKNSTDTGGALYHPGALSACSGLNFLNNDYGVEVFADAIATFNDWTFDDVSGKYDVNNTSTGTRYVYKMAGSNPNSYAGNLVVFVAPVAVINILTKDFSTKAVIEDVAITIRAASGGDYPFEDSVSITSTAGTATVSHTAHGLSTDQKIEIDGANENEYNRIKTITVTGDDAYTYPVSGTPDSPATGTITATAIIIDGLTNSSGLISDSRIYTADQPVSGQARKGSNMPVYIDQSIDDTIDDVNGLTITLLLIPDS